MSIFCYKNELINPLVAISDITNPLAITPVIPQFGKTNAPMALANDPVTNTGTLEVVFPATTSIDTVIIGAHRYDPAGFRFSGGSVTVHWFNAVTGLYVALPTVLLTSPVNESVYIPLGSVIASTQFKLVFSNLAVLTNIFIPELFMGLSHKIINPDYGQDFQAVASKVISLDSESGTLYESRQYRRIETRPSWSTLLANDVTVLKPFIDYIQAKREPFFAVLIEPDVAACYFFKVKSRTLPLKRTNAVQSSLSLNLIEAV